MLCCVMLRCFVLDCVVVRYALLCCYAVYPICVWVGYIMLLCVVLCCVALRLFVLFILCCVGVI